MRKHSIKILYIAGWARVGSTILSRVLHQLEGYLSIGEFRYVWDRGLQENRICGTGDPFRESPFWKDIFDQAYGGMDEAPAERMTALYRRITPKRALGWMMLPRGGPQPRGVKFFLKNLERVYRALQEKSNATVIIDSSKVGTYGHLLSRLDGFDVRTVHLVRDPRAVAFSWQRQKKRTDVYDGSMMHILHPADSAFHWWYWNMVAEWLAWRWGQPYIRVRYEDFIENPRTETEQLLKFMDTPQGNHPFLSENKIELKPDVAVSGNPIRLRTGVTTLRADDEWRQKLSPCARRWTLAICGRMMKRYGYRP